MLQELVSSTIKDVAPCQKELHVQVGSEAIQQELESVYRDLKRVAHVPGFRVGSAPRDLLEKHYAAKAREEVIRRLIEQSLGEALKGQGTLDLVGQPRVTDVQFDPSRRLSYVAHLEVAPEVPLGKYKRLRLNRPKVEIADSKVKEILSGLQEAHAELKPVLEPRPAAEGDFILADLTEQGQGSPPKKRRDVLIHLKIGDSPAGEKTVPSLLGMKIGEKRTLSLDGGAGVTVELKGIKTKALNPLDDTFAKTVGPFETLGALESAIREDLKRQTESAHRKGLEHQAAAALLEEWNFDVPPSLVGLQARRVLKERTLDLIGQGVPAAEVEQKAQMLAEQAKLDALRQVKLFYILRRIAQEEKMLVTEEEVEERMQALAKRLRLSVEEVRTDLEKRDLVEELAWEITRGKVYDLLLKEAEILSQ